MLDIDGRTFEQVRTDRLSKMEESTDLGTTDIPRKGY